MTTSTITRALCPVERHSSTAGARRLSAEVWLAFLDDLLAGAYRPEPPVAAHLRRCHALQTQYADLGLEVVDASVLALVERLGERTLAALDRRHFTVVRLADTNALELAPG